MLGILIVLMLFVGIATVMTNILKSGAKEFPSLCPKPLPPASCEDVGMMTSEICPQEHPCVMKGANKKKKDCFSVTGSPLPTSGEKINEKSSAIVNSWTIAHNRRRSAFDTQSGKPIGNVEWSSDLEKKAKEIVRDILDTETLSKNTPKRMHFLKGKGCSQGGCGYNAFLAKNSRATPEKSLSKWYSQQCPDFKGRVKHDNQEYAQVVWRDVKKIGCAAATASPLKIGDEAYSSGGISVCVYDKPPVGDVADQMPPPGSCMKVFGTLSGAASQGLSRAYRADASLVASRTAGDGRFAGL